MSVWVADPAHRAHEHEAKTRLNIAPALLRQVTKPDQWFVVTHCLCHQVLAVRVEACDLFDPIVDRLERFKDGHLGRAPIKVAIRHLPDTGVEAGYASVALDRRQSAGIRSGAFADDKRCALDVPPLPA